MTLRELESIKTSSKKDEEVKYKARRLTRLFNDNLGKYTVVNYSSSLDSVVGCLGLDSSIPDVQIVGCASLYNQKVPIVFVSGDLSCSNIARNIFHLEVEHPQLKNPDNHYGFKEVTMTDNEMAEFYSNPEVNTYGLELNEYLIIKNSLGEIVDYRKWDGQYSPIKYEKIKSHSVGLVKPINPQQVIAFDMLQNNSIPIKVITGKFGVGKDKIMIANALNLVTRGDYERLIWVRNAIPVSNAGEIGYLPGDLSEKLKPYYMILADHLGGEQGLEIQMMQGNIEIQHLGHIRGRDLKNSIIYCSEAENLTKEHVQLLIGRVGEGSALWMNGDFKQTDSSKYKNNNGLTIAIERLTGHKNFAHVKLLKTERSEVAAMADLLD